MINTLPRHRTYLILFLFVMVAMGVNIRKAVHIDDSAYLQIAKAIILDPLHPLSQEINWGNTTEPIFAINQPLFIPYVYAILIRLFGYSELVLHLFIAFCTGLAALFFHLILIFFRVRNPLFLTGLFILGPAFLPEQNLMVDVPLIASWLVFYWAILTAEKREGRYFLAGIAVSIACLCKYTSLVLLPVFLFVILFRRHWRSLWTLGIPVLILLLWSAFNYYDVGAIHMFGRPSPILTTQTVAYRLISWIAGIGSVAPFIISFIYLNRSSRLDLGWLIISIAGGVLLYLFMVRTGQKIFAFYWTPFFIAGVFLNGMAISLLIRNLRAAWRAGDRETIIQEGLLGLWIAGTTAFIILFSPFIAIRHILLVIPPFLILLGRNLSQRGYVVSRDAFSFGLTVLLGLVLAISDYVYADIYRDYAYIIKDDLPSNELVYQTGHWGWEWYSLDAGMIQYDTEKSRLRKGNYLVIPTAVAGQQISPKQVPHLQEVERINIPAPAATWLRTMSGGGYYAFGFPHSTPWMFSKAPFEFVIYRVRE
ncbi:MAG TPA: glycosyltransferase family 39 protein [Anaerolineales bacterium]|nr:glycosyltransferase family 39 protein [Anaerolineales bacterium]